MNALEPPKNLLQPMSLKDKPYLQKFIGENYEVYREDKLELVPKADYVEIDMEKVGDLLSDTEVIF